MARRLTSTTRWLRWLTPGLQIKRWLLLLMVSELVLVLGVAYALKEVYQTAHLPSFFYYITLQFLPYWARAIMFGIFGVGLLLVSYLKLTQSVLGPFLPGNTTTSVVEVIHAFRLRGRGPRVVAIGGGTGLSSLLRGLKMYTSNLSAIVTVADDGGSSGRLRDEYRILPPGDFRQCLIALADAEPLMKQLFDHRFKEGSLNGHAFGNLFIMAMADVTGNFEQALRESGKVLAVKGTIVPSTLQDVTLVASINGDLPGFLFGKTNGHLLVIRGFDTNGDVITNDPAAKTAPEVRKLYGRADFERVWLGGSGGIVYVIYPRGKALPPNVPGLPPNW